MKEKKVSPRRSSLEHSQQSGKGKEVTLDVFRNISLTKCKTEWTSGLKTLLCTDSHWYVLRNDHLLCVFRIFNVTEKEAQPFIFLHTVS